MTGGSHRTDGEAVRLKVPPVHMALLDAILRDAQSVGFIVQFGFGTEKNVVVEGLLRFTLLIYGYT